MVNFYVADALPDDSYPWKKNENGCNHMGLLFVPFAKRKLTLCFNLTFLGLAIRDANFASVSK